MTRRAPLLLVFGIVTATPAMAVAQNVYLYPEAYYGFGGDTAFSIPIGKTRRAYLYGSVSGGVSSYSVTVFFDTTRIRIVRADSVPGYGLAAPSITSIANGATLAATGSSSSGYLALLELEMRSGATQGSLLSLRVNQWLTQAGAPAPQTSLRTALLQTCLARALWGDPDSSLTVTGRDALIALTSAVGLPVSGFNLTLADVDDDLTVTSRDALLMLSYAIGGTDYYYYYYYRTGMPEAAACAPQAGVPSDMVFIRDDASNGMLYRVAAGDTVATAIGSTTQFGDVSQFARWSPDGTRVLATAYTGTYYYEPIAVTVATQAQDTLAKNTAYDGGGSYSPDGSRIAFYSDRSLTGCTAAQGGCYLWAMDAATGANPARLQTTTTVTNYSASNPAWSPNGQRVAFTGYQTCCTSGLWSVLVADGTVRLEFPLTGSYFPTHPSWSPAGDSLLFQASSRLYKVAAPDTATVPGEAVSLSAGMDWASWTTAGIVFRLLQATSGPSTYDYYLRQPDGRIVKIFQAGGTQDVGASFR